MIKDRKTDRVSEAISQMSKMIERFVNTSLKGDLFDKAIECLKELRVASITEDEAPSFNRFARHIKQLFGNPPNNAFFEQLKATGITLITKHETFSSTLDTIDAQDYLAGPGKKEENTGAIKANEDDLDDEIE
jgi:ATP-dependent DNA helicase 2 subunit 2